MSENLDYADPDENYFDDRFRGNGNSNPQNYFSIQNLNSVLTQDFNELFIIHVNIRSFNANIDSFIALFDSLKTPPTVIVLSETWLNQSSLSAANIPGYNGFHTCRSESGRGRD